MNIDIIIKVIIPILGAILTYVVVPLIRKKVDREDLEYIYSWVTVAVRSAEQMHKAGLITIPKKEYVVEYLQSKGFNISKEDLDNLIEAAVKELNMEMGDIYD